MYDVGPEVDFSIKLDDSVCLDFDHGSGIESYAIDESSEISSLVETDISVGSWADFILKSGITRTALEPLPSRDGVLRRSVILASFYNQNLLQRFFTANLDRAINVTSLGVGGISGSQNVATAETSSLYPNSGNNIYPPVVSSESYSETKSSKDGEILAFRMYENTSYNGTFNKYGYGATHEGFISNKWRSICETLYARTTYDLYQLSAGWYMRPGAKYRVVFHVAYKQSYYRHGLETGNVFGEKYKYAYIVGAEVTVTSGLQFVPRSNLFTSNIIDGIRSRFWDFKPTTNGFMSPTNCPLWGELSKTIPQHATWQMQASLTRNYEETIILKPIGFIVTLGDHTKWW